ncbi:hypothetical protein PMAYCL1PPCAC_17931, partial [Pristionchus mayeri]
SLLSPDWSTMASSPPHSPSSPPHSPSDPSTLHSLQMANGPLGARRSIRRTILPANPLTVFVAVLSLLGFFGVVLSWLQKIVGVEGIVGNLTLIAGLFVGYWTYMHSYKLNPR